MFALFQKEYTVKQKLYWLLSSLLAASFLMLVIPIEIDFHSKRDIAVSLFYFILIASLFLFVSQWLLYRQAFTTSCKVKKYEWLIYALVPFTIWSIWLLAFYPASMSQDSFYQWWQVVTNRYNSWHPIFHTIMMRWLSRIWDSPTIIALFQITTFSLSIGSVLYAFAKQGVSKIVIYITLLVLTLSPLNAYFVITIWKDIPYSIAILLLVFLLFKITTDKDSLRKIYMQLCLAILVVTVTNLRLNGFPIWVGTYVLLFWLYKNYRKQVIVSGVMSILIFFAIKTIIHSNYEVSKNGGSFGLPAHHIAAHIAAGEVQDQDIRRYLDTIRPLKSKWGYNCLRTTGTIFFDFDINIVRQDQTKFLMTALYLAVKNPMTELEHTTCVSKLVWRVTSDNDNLNYVFNLHREKENQQYEYIITPKNLSHIVENSKLPTLQNYFGKTVELINDTFIVRPAFYLYLLLFGIFIAIYRSKDFKYLLIFSPVFIQVFVMLFANVAQDTRYQYPVIIVCYLFVFYLLFGVKKETK